MVVVNESYRYSITEKPYTAYGFTAINSDVKSPQKCSWIAHNNTSYCKQHHVKFLKDYFYITDKIYFGAIQTLHSTGNYMAANILFLVILFPFIMWYSLVKIIDYTIAIRKLKTSKNQRNE
ncbi:hypothetical protein KO504_05065 [Winogradskyella psychrotolerans]|uniref:Uncharacterized protein n=2 Tax=Flavobacteriaceae TaxID=49546 RepID=A0ABP8CS94_9FLAO|nr:hypothetical protein [Winogradskyella psychrotolerans]